MCNEQCSTWKDLRLFELFMGFKQGDDVCFSYIIKRFGRLIEKESFNRYLGIIDEDLRAQIYFALFIRLRRYEIPDVSSIEIMEDFTEQQLQTGGVYEYQP